MNLHLKDVVCTSRVVGTSAASDSQDGDRFWRMEECFVRGNSVKYMRIPDEVISLLSLQWMQLAHIPQVVDAADEENERSADLLNFLHLLAAEKKEKVRGRGKSIKLGGSNAAAQPGGPAGRGRGAGHAILFLTIPTAKAAGTPRPQGLEEVRLLVVVVLIVGEVAAVDAVRGLTSFEILSLL